MTMRRWTRNTNGLLAAVHARAESARYRADSAIDELAAEQEPVNFNTGAARAGVTKAYLYAHADLRERIDRLRRPWPTADRRVAELEAEVRRLRSELEARLTAVNR